MMSWLELWAEPAFGVSKGQVVGLEKKERLLVVVVVLVVVVGGVVVVVLVMCCHLYCLFPPND